MADLLALLKDAGVACEAVSHEPRTSAEAQPPALAGVSATKSVFLKDKKNRLYIVTAMSNTPIDLVLLSYRMGLGRGGIKFAEPELVSDWLQCASEACVSPLALVHPGTKGTVLVLDHKILSEAKVVVALPSSLTTSLSMDPSSLQAAIRHLGGEPQFADLEIQTKIDRDNPPDMAKLIPETAAVAPIKEDPPAAAAAGAAPAADKAPAPKAAAAAAPKASKGKGSKEPAAPAVDPALAAAAQLRALTDVQTKTEELLQTVSQALLGCKLEEAKALEDPYILSRLRADVQSQVNSLKNAAYAAGYVAGKGEVVAFAQGRFA